MLGLTRRMFGVAVAIVAVTGVTVPVAASDEPPQRPPSACHPDGLTPRHFDDVPGGPHAENISCAANWHLVQGVDFDNYRPTGTAFRAQMATMLSRLGGRSGGLEDRPFDHRTATNPFEDVAFHSAHGYAIVGLYERGIVAGVGDGRFEPNEDVTRGQMATFVARLHRVSYGEEIADTVSTFPDVPPGSTHGADIGRLAAAGITVGDVDGNFRPRDPMSRAQLASFMARYLELVHDAGRIPPEFYPHRPDD